MAHILSPEAEAELDGIWLYIAKESGNPDIADRFIDTLSHHFHRLALNPRIGRRRDRDLRPGVRSFPVGNYIILYRIEREDVQILNVIRGSRNIAALLSHYPGAAS
jgi:toxin ParE1/3/4